MAEWAYQGDKGCANWGKIGYSISDSGKQQSPIDITTSTCMKCIAAENTLALKDIGTFQCRVVNTGFTARVDFVPKTQHIRFEDDDYGLIQFHFHSPSEHTVDKESEDLELHLVHESMTTPGKLAVIGIMFHAVDSTEKKYENEFLSNVFGVIPKEKSVEAKIFGGLDLDGLDMNGPYWRYDGSLTTPPCSECVNWIVMQNIHTMTRDQLKKYLEFFPMETNRPVQKIFDRKIKMMDV